MSSLNIHIHSLSFEFVGILVTNVLSVFLEEVKVLFEDIAEKEDKTDNIRKESCDDEDQIIFNNSISDSEGSIANKSNKCQTNENNQTDVHMFVLQLSEFGDQMSVNVFHILVVPHVDEVVEFLGVGNGDVIPVLPVKNQREIVDIQEQVIVIDVDYPFVGGVWLEGLSAFLDHSQRESTAAHSVLHSGSRRLQIFDIYKELGSFMHNGLVFEEKDDADGNQH